MKKKIYEVPQVRFVVLRPQAILCGSETTTISTDDDPKNAYSPADGDEGAAKRGFSYLWDE